mmetsp:Transcript_28055/g.77152  ORF Transcript_28055/g.77152 Transcript_28055/m.77152 type:complete len:220 (+) Transcript_28055:171-830(+)
MKLALFCASIALVVGVLTHTALAMDHHAIDSLIGGRKLQKRGNTRRLGKKGGGKKGGGKKGSIIEEECVDRVDVYDGRSRRSPMLCGDFPLEVTYICENLLITEAETETGVEYSYTDGRHIVAKNLDTGKTFSTDPAPYSLTFEVVDDDVVKATQIGVDVWTLYPNETAGNLGPLPTGQAFVFAEGYYEVLVTDIWYFTVADGTVLYDFCAEVSDDTYY